MNRIVTIMMLIGLSLPLITGCDDSLDKVNAKKGSKGAQNVELAGKTFSRTKNVDKITKTETKYTATGDIESQIETEIPVTQVVKTLEFKDDNTFTLTLDYQFTENFDKLYSWSHKDESNREDETYVEFNLYNIKYNTTDFNRPINDNTYSAYEGDILGDTVDSAYSGYAEKSYKKEIYTGEWKKEDLPSDGLEEITYIYNGRITKAETTTLICRSIIKPDSSVVGETGTQLSHGYYTLESGEKESGYGIDVDGDEIADGVDTDYDDVIDYAVYGEDDSLPLKYNKNTTTSVDTSYENSTVMTNMNVEYIEDSEDGNAIYSFWEHALELE
ncbi:MAG: hypothetical protein PF637_13585 [Spirochaetes bacterium]|jgi:hypothetical protein|nr:hypothetical protein [Spirochaetota bacterium]